MRKQSETSRMWDMKISLLYSLQKVIVIKKIKGFWEEGALLSHKKTKMAHQCNERTDLESEFDKSSSKVF